VSDPAADLAITGCTALVHGAEEGIDFLEDATIVVRDGVIASINARGAAPRLAIRNIPSLLAPDGVFFVDNLDDTEAGLCAILQRSIHDVDLRTEGGGAAFVARGPIHDA
jgi:hypothetical protein